MKKRIVVAAVVSILSASAAHSAPSYCQGSYLNALVVGLNPKGFNNLSVHPFPGSSEEIDELVNDDVVCLLGSSGPWDHVQYVRDGILHTGWAHSKWIAKWGSSRYGD
jgi:hypothetical protein